MALLTRISWVLFVVGLVAWVLSFIVVGTGLLSAAIMFIRWGLAIAIVLFIVQLVARLLGSSPPP